MSDYAEASPLKTKSENNCCLKSDGGGKNIIGQQTISVSFSYRQEVAAVRHIGFLTRYFFSQHHLFEPPHTPPTPSLVTLMKESEVWTRSCKHQRKHQRPFLTATETPPPFFLLICITGGPSGGVCSRCCSRFTPRVSQCQIRFCQPVYQKHHEYNGEKKVFSLIEMSSAKRIFVHIVFSCSCFITIAMEI